MTDREGRCLKVLVIDDERFMRKMIRGMLADIGITEIYEAADAKAGLEETLRNRPHVVLCDIFLPGPDGLSYLGWLRESPIRAASTTPVIMVTAEKSQDTVLIAKNLKADGYLIKPISTLAVQRAISRALSARPPAIATS